MKKLIISFIAAFSLIAIGLTVLLIFAVNGNANSISTVNLELKLVNKQKISLADITTIDIDYYSEDINFYTSDTNELILKEYRTNYSEDDELSKITVGDGKIYIKGPKPKSKSHFVPFGIFNYYSRIDIYLPTEYAGSLFVSTSSGDINSDNIFKLVQFKLSCTSGDIRMNEVYTEDIDVSSSSGEITLQVAEGKRQISSTSGNIKVYGGSGDSNFSASSGEVTIKNASGVLKVDTTSGNIEIADSNGEKNIEASSGEISITNSSGVVQVSSSSGDVRISALDGGGNISTTSGKVLYELKDVNDDIDIETSSGDVTLEIPDMVNFDFTADTSSGDIRTFFDDALSFNKDGDRASGTVGENPDKTIEISTTSGEITVNKN